MGYRISTQYDLIIPEGDNFDENRSRQLQNIFGRCSSYLQSLPLTTVHRHKSSLLVEPKINQNLKQQYDVDVEEANYGSSSLEEVHKQKEKGDYDWDQGCFIYD